MPTSPQSEVRRRVKAHRERLRGQRVEPGQAIRTGHGDDATVAEMDHGLPGGQQLLFAQRIAVVLGRVTDRPGQLRERVAHLESDHPA